MSETLTERERQVLRLIASGKSTKQLAAELGITFKTAACHRYRLLGKVGACNTAELVSLAIRTGLLDLSGNGTGAKPDATERASQVCAESMKGRALLRAEIERAAVLRRECRKAREDFAAERQRIVTNCRSLLKAVRNVSPPSN